MMDVRICLHFEAPKIASRESRVACLENLEGGNARVEKTTGFKVHNKQVGKKQKISNHHKQPIPSMVPNPTHLYSLYDTIISEFFLKIRRMVALWHCGGDC